MADPGSAHAAAAVLRADPAVIADDQHEEPVQQIDRQTADATSAPADSTPRRFPGRQAQASATKQPITGRNGNRYRLWALPPPDANWAIITSSTAS